MKLTVLGAALSLLAGAAAAEPYWGGNSVSRPIEWAAAPSAEEAARAYPAGQTGTAAYMYGCGVGAGGRLLDCRLHKTQGQVDPALERAARRLLTRYLVAPVTADGLRTRGQAVSVWIAFQGDSKTVKAGGSAHTFVLWSAGPDQAALDAAYPADADGMISASFGCAAAADGGLTGCKDMVAALDPTHQARARSLLSHFRVPVTTEAGLRTAGLPLVVKVDLVKPGTPPPPVASPIIPNPFPGSPVLLGGRDVVLLSRSSRGRRIGADLPVTVLQYVTADPACRSVPVEIVVTLAPEHGRVEVEDTGETVYPGRLSPTDPRRACAPATFAGKRVVYTPEPGYTGRDRVVVSIRSDGRVIEDVTDFDVRQ